MDDNDLDAFLLQQFSSMATQDRDVLITQFKSFLGNQPLNDAGCAFFLDMNNWNLQDALCSYFEYHADATVYRLPRMTLVTNGEADGCLSSEPILSTPCSRFTKTWHMSNPGEEAWPPGCCLRYFSGTQLTSSDRVIVNSLPPGGSACVQLEINSPSENGTYRAQWRMSTITGSFFGDIVWLIVQVTDDVINDTHSVSSASMSCFPSPASTNIQVFAQSPTHASQMSESEHQADGMDMS